MSALGYHLRTNKAVDRRVFFDLLLKLSSKYPISDYVYIGLGGDTLEDFREAHQLFNFSSMISLEMEDSVLRRQSRNRPFSNIDCRHCMTGEFIGRFDAEVQSNSIVWLDYTSTKYQSQFNEIRTLLRSLRRGDILKITLNATAEALYKSISDEEAEENIFPRRLARLREKLGNDYFPTTLNEDNVKWNTFPAALSKAFEKLIEYEKSELGTCLIPLTRFRYVDHKEQMFTLTGIIEDYHDLSWKDDCKLNSWEFLSDNYEDVTEISVPSLSMREKAEIDQFLPSGMTEEAKNDYPLDCNAIKSKKLIESYIKFYRFYPNYQRVNQ